MSEAKIIVLYFKQSKPFKELFLNSNVVHKWFGNVFKEIDSAGMIRSINKLGIDIYQKLIGRKFDESTEIDHVFTVTNEYFKKSFEDSTDPIYKVLLEYWLILTNIVKKNETISSDKNDSVTFEDIKNILNLSFLIMFYMDKYSM